MHAIQTSMPRSDDFERSLKAMKAASPASEWVLLDEVSPLSVAEQPAKFSALVAAFLQRIG